MASKKYECWDDMEEAPDLGMGMLWEGRTPAEAAEEFADVDGMSDGDTCRVCVRVDGAIKCFEVKCSRSADVREVEYKP